MMRRWGTQSRNSRTRSRRSTSLRELRPLVAERRRGPASDALVSVRLTHKFAEWIDGVDLSQVEVGDRLQLPSREAALLIAEGWAVPCREPVSSKPCEVPTDCRRAEAADGQSGFQQHGPVVRSIQRPAAQTIV